ncbi:MAG: glycoside hydrolase [Chthonomonadaceae bacterium]|nr:glycoside hydrolase [Chthonomonadaceae bacterium]
MIRAIADHHGFMRGSQTFGDSHHRTLHKADYLDTAKRLYVWTNAHLQDTGGLYWDNVKFDGRVEKTKFTYNTALMLRADALLHKITGEQKYLEEAEQVAKASEAHWFQKETGAITDSGMFAHHLCEAFFALAKEDHNPHWGDIVTQALVFVSVYLTPQPLLDRQKLRLPAFAVGAGRFQD